MDLPAPIAEINWLRSPMMKAMMKTTMMKMTMMMMMKKASTIPASLLPDQDSNRTCFEVSVGYFNELKTTKMTMMKTTMTTMNLILCNSNVVTDDLTKTIMSLYPYKL